MIVLVIKTLVILKLVQYLQKFAVSKFDYLKLLYVHFFAHFRPLHYHFRNTDESAVSYYVLGSSYANLTPLLIFQAQEVLVQKQKN